MGSLELWHQPSEQLGAVAHLFIYRTGNIRQRACSIIAPLCIGIGFALPVELCQLQEQCPLRGIVSRDTATAFLIGVDGRQGVALRQMDIADGIMDGTEIVFVLIGGGHTLQPAHHATCIGGRQDAGLCNPRLKLQCVGRLQADDVAIGFKRLSAVALPLFHLSEDVPEACPALAATLVADAPREATSRLGILSRAEIVVGEGEVPVGHGLSGNTVVLLTDDEVFGLVAPSQLHIALGLPGPGARQDDGLRLVETSHIGEGGGTFFKLSFLKLRLTEEQPGAPQEGVVLAAVEPFDVGLGLAPLLVPFWSALDTVAYDGLLGFLYGAVKLAVAECLARAVSYSIEGQQSGVVVTIAPFLLLTPFDEGLRSVEISVVARRKSVPETRLSGILLRGTRGCKKHKEQQGYRS